MGEHDVVLWVVAAGAAGGAYAGEAEAEDHCEYLHRGREQRDKMEESRAG